MNSGDRARDLAMPILWRLPPSSSWGYAFMSRLARPTVSISSAIFLFRSAAEEYTLFTSRGSAMSSDTDSRGFRLE